MHHQTPEVHYQSHLLLEQAAVSKSVVELLEKVLSTVVDREHLLQGLFRTLLFSRFTCFDSRYFFFTTCPRRDT